MATELRDVLIHQALNGYVLTGTTRVIDQDPTMPTPFFGASKEYVAKDENEASSATHNFLTTGTF